jgi:hypothetical protein
MNASKENAKQANADVYDVCQAIGSLRGAAPLIEKLERVRVFLDVARRKLPTEKAFRAERQRRKHKAK